MAEQKVAFEHPVYEIDENGVLKNKETKEAISGIASVDEGEQLVNAIISYVHGIMKTEMNFQEVWIPEETAEAKTSIFATENYTEAKKLLVFVASGRGLMPGIWSRSVVVRAGLKSGSMLPYFKSAEKEGFGIVVMNPSVTHALVSREDGSLEKIKIPFSSTGEEHVAHIWEKYIASSMATEISFVCFGYGGHLVKHLLNIHGTEMIDKIGGIAFLESSHRSEDTDNDAVKLILSEKSICFESAELPFGTKLTGAAPYRTGCTCISAGKPDKRRSGDGSNAAYTIAMVMKPVFQFLQQKNVEQFAQTVSPPPPPQPQPSPRKGGRTYSVEKQGALSPTIQQGSEKQCNVCGISFSLFERRHHCRMCGRAVCGTCSPDRLFLPGASTAQRVCVECVKDGKPRRLSAESRMTSMIDEDGNRKKDEKLTIEDFDLLKVVGKGAFGKVMLVRKKAGVGAGCIYAMKVLKKQAVFEKNQVEHTKAERRILRDIEHPFIVRLRFAFQSEDKLYLAMDYYAGGSLFFHLRRSRRFSEARARFYAAGLVVALAQLHKMDIAYRDLKLENILMDADGYVALTDFGLSKENVDLPNGATTFCGTAEYIAPELLKGQAYGKAVDWWSFGSLVYEMITGQTPFYDKNRKRMFHNILYRDVQFTPVFSEESQSLLVGLLRRDPQKRLGSAPDGADEIKEHSWFASIDWDLLLEKKIPAPFRPDVKDETDVSNVANVFTKEIPKDSPAAALLSQTTKAKAHFDDFTYMGESELDR